MSSIDERVVEAKFDNRQFQAGVKDTLGSLNNLNKGLQLNGATKGLSELDGATTRVSHGFQVMRIAAGVAIATIAHQATLAGERFVKAFTIGPLLQGLDIYHTKLNAIQTILANTGLKGPAGMAKVNGALAQLNKYSNQTIYNFSEMARNIGTFTAAGVKLDTSVGAIKGIANLAAVSGSNAQQASTAMYQLSQALAAGRVKLQDWNSVVNAGMGGKVFQTALKDTARVHHVAIDKMVKDEGGFRNTLQKGWLTSQILTETLNKFTGDLTNKQLKAQGYTTAQIKKIQELAKTATDAATKVKTFPQLMDVLKESVATGWANTWEILIGNIGEAKKVFTGINNVVGGFITRSAQARNKVLGDWKALGGRTVLISGIKDAFKELGAVFKPIHDAFREIFPRKTGQDLYNMTVAFKNFIDKFKMGATTVDEIKRTFAGLFAVLDIGWQLIKAGLHFLGQMLGSISGTTGGIFQFTASLGDMLVNLDQALKKGHGFTKFFDSLHNILAPIINLLGMTRIKIVDLGIGVAATFKGLTQTAPKILHSISTAIHNFMNGMVGSFHFSSLLQGINAGLFGGLLLLIHKFIKHLEDRSKKPSPLQSFIDKITEPFHELTDTLKSMQKALQAATILEIAIAVGILTASVVALSMIDTAKLAKALAALTVMFTQLVGSLWLFNRVGGAKGLFTTSAGLVVFATALRVLTSSVKALAQLGWEQLAKGLAGVTVLLGVLVATTKGMQGDAAGMIRTGTGLTILAAGIKILASAVADLAKLSWGQLAKGLTGVAATLLALGLFTKFAGANAGGIAQGAGIVLLAAGIKILASAAQDFAKLSWQGLAKGFASLAGILLAVSIFSNSVGNPVKLMAASAALIGIGVAMNILAVAMNKFGKLSWGQIAKGLVSMAGALILITAAMNAMPITSVLSAAALVGVAIALVGIGKALQVMGGMSWGEIAKGLVALAGSLTILTAAMYGMEGALLGAAAMMVVASALALLVPELVILGKLSWSEIIKGLVALAGVFAVLGLAGLLLEPVIPALFGLAGSIALLGLGLAAIGAAVYLFATGLQILAIAGAGAGAAIKIFVTDIIQLLPMIVKAFGDTLVAFAKATAQAAPQLMKTAIVLMDVMLTAINREGPKIIRTFFHLVISLLTQLANAVPKIAAAAVKILLAILNAIAKNAPKIIHKFVDIVVGVIEALAKGEPRIVTAAVDWLIAMVKSIGNNMKRVVSAGTDAVIAFIKGLGNNAKKLANAAMDVVISFINGLAKAINTHTDDFRKAGKNLGGAILNGMTLGLAKGKGGLLKKATGIFGGVLGVAHSVFNTHSPSKEFEKIGRWIDEGLAKGIVGGRSAVQAAWKNTHDLLRQAIDNAKKDIQDYQQKLKDLNKNPKKNADAITNITAKLHEARIELKASSDALEYMNKQMVHQHDHLLKLGKRYDELSNKLDKANQKLKDAKQAESDYNKQIVDQYSQQPDIAPDTKLTDYFKSQKKQIADTQTFIEVLARLRKMGLDDTSYRNLLSKGTDALPFAEQLLAGGKKSVKEIDSLDSQLQKQARTLGSNASSALYQAGVDSAQGVVDGLHKKRHALAVEMQGIAHDLVVELKKELKIKSPSQVFDQLGQFTGLGLARGLKKSVPHVQKATRSLGQNTIESMKQSIREMNDLMAIEGNLNPTIQPVLDLSTVRKQAAGVSDIFGNRLSVDSTYAKATNASLGYEANHAATAPGDSSTNAPGNVTFIQNNNSPKALSSAEIYRQTNNQLSRAKGALKPDAA